MIEYAQELVSLVDRARAVDVSLTKKTQELNEREALCVQREKDLDLRKSALDAREASIVPIENMAEWKKGVQAQSDKNSSEREALEADKKKWATQVQADKSQIEQDRLTSKKEADCNEANRKNLEGMAKDRAKEILAQFGHADLAGKI